MTDSHKKVDIESLLQKYDRPGPRYTSYPTAPVWNDKFGSEQYREALNNASSAIEEPLSLYLHIPFCRKRCWFCGCNTTTLKKAETHASYLKLVAQEAALVGKILGQRKNVSQFHWGGGTPSCLDDDNTLAAFKIFSEQFEIERKAEISIELDPRITYRERIQLLKKLGFNRLSLGIQDFDSEVQAAIGRNQNEEDAIELYRYCREEGFRGINFDLIYGLPRQRLDQFRKTVEQTIRLKPDRIALYNFAYLPESKPHQKLINPGQLPSPQEKLELFLTAREMFLAGGYCLIGMDHFVLPDDELAIARKKGRLRRNFMGYTVKAARDWLGFGMSSISYVDNCFAQNLSSMSEYEQAVGGKDFAVYRGMRLSKDDLIRQYLISELMCNFRIDTAELSNRFEIDFGEYFSDVQDALLEFVNDGLVEKQGDSYTVTDVGTIFVRNIAMAFDAYLKDGKLKVQFSRTV